MAKTPQPKRKRRWLRRVLLIVIGLPLLFALLFSLNGLWPGWKTPETGTTKHAQRTGTVKRVRVMAFNIAKCFAHQGGMKFRDESEVKTCLDRIAALMQRERVDLAFLSEINFDCAPCGSINQVEYLADKAGFHSWSFGANYSFGVFFYRIRSGNALLSRFALEPVGVKQLRHGTPFYNPMGNRRLLWMKIPALGGVRAGALRNDSFDIDRNRDQVEQLLADVPATGALLGGDFNAWPGTQPITLFQRSGRFNNACFEGPPTFPVDKPKHRIDFIVAPKAWRLVEQHVVKTDVSDHLPVVATFEMPEKSR
ncbi:MAG: endonuclease/exonuclease/phosphatase family protein [Myxococcales bacterium]|nr:endonuclease/exonuclease/phosphatase family protein [Myxococcales bacterium]